MEMSNLRVVTALIPWDIAQRLDQVTNPFDLPCTGWAVHFPSTLVLSHVRKTWAERV